MEEFLDLLRLKINELSGFINRLQSIIGLSNDTNDTIFGKLNTLETTVENIAIPKYYTEKVTITGNNFRTMWSPMNGVCMYDEVTLYHPDEGTLIWEGVIFSGKIGVLDGAGNDFDGWTMKIQYFYI